MNTIWKYPIKITDTQIVIVPRGSVIRHVGLDPGDEPCIWCQVNTATEMMVGLVVAVVGTGHPAPENMQHVGSFRDRAYMWHVFSGHEVDVA